MFINRFELPLFIVMVFFGVGGLMEFTGRYHCSQYEKGTGKSTKYMTFNACYVESHGEWLNLDEHKAAIVAKHGLSNPNK